LKDKEDGIFVIPAIYRPFSNIPLELWQAAPAATNGNEQAHRNINRDGTRLTLLAAIMRGLQFDVRSLSSLDLFNAVGIHMRDRLPTYYLRTSRAVLRDSK